MNVSLSPELDRYVLSKVQSGRYSSATEVLSAALRLLQERDQEQDASLAHARDQIRAGLQSLEQGNFSQGTAMELYGEAVKRSRQRLAERKGP